MRRVSTRVLPEPAPARMASGTVSTVTAWRCSSLSPASSPSASDSDAPSRGSSVNSGPAVDMGRTLPTGGDGVPRPDGPDPPGGRKVMPTGSRVGDA
jgi:hypothetical protein